MTRLTSEDIKDIPASLAAYDRKLQQKTGMGLQEIGIRAAGYSAALLDNLELSSRKAAVIPVTAGLGEITGFTPAVRAILEHLGFTAFITGAADVAGFREALRKKAEIILLADDNSFIAKNTNNSCWLDNDRATARSYLTALEALTGSLKDREVLILGGGRVGREAVEFLLEKQARPVATDIKERRLKLLEENFKQNIKFFSPAEVNISRYSCIFDATPARNIITEEMIDDETYLAAPGIPAGFTSRAAERLGDRLIHDPLQLGVAAMAFTGLFES